MSNRIEAPGHTALWTEAALRALTGTAFLCDQDGDASQPHEPMTADYARVIALDAMAIATAFERACEDAHAAEQESARERVRTIGRFRSVATETLFTVESVEVNDVTFALLPGEHRQRHSTVERVLDPECYTPEPLDAPTPTGGEERA